MERRDETPGLGDPAITAEIRPITKFRKRVYVPKGGISMLGSKQLMQIDPVDIKRLAKGAHTKDLPESALKHGMVRLPTSRTTTSAVYIRGSESLPQSKRFNGIMFGRLLRCW